MYLSIYTPPPCSESWLVGSKGLPVGPSRHPKKCAMKHNKWYIENDFSIFGDDYNTRDGTGERDYLHISDLIEGHFSALSHLKNISSYEVFNLGTGKGITVLELLDTFEKVSGMNIQKNIKNRRLGDVDVCYSEPSKSNKILKLNAERSLFNMCDDAIKSIKRNIDEL